jgi:hypothetical protein
VAIWWQFGGNLVVIWWQFGGNLVAIWWQFGGNLSIYGLFKTCRMELILLQGRLFKYVSSTAYIEGGHNGHLLVTGAAHTSSRKKNSGIYMHMRLTVPGVLDGFAIKEVHNLQTNLL